MRELSFYYGCVGFSVLKTGIKAKVIFPVQIQQEENLLRVTGMTEIAQTDFGIKPLKGVAGGLRLKDRVNVKFEILAERVN